MIAKVLKFTVTVKLTESRVYTQAGAVIVINTMAKYKILGTTFSADNMTQPRSDSVEDCC